MTKTARKRFSLSQDIIDYYEFTKQSVYLGHSYVNALSRLNHVKSFLQEY